jgi:hypothetical protein
MPSRARQVFNHMLVPTVIVGLWTYAHLESVRQRDWVSMWTEDGVIRVGNPYETPVPKRFLTPPDEQADAAGDVDDDRVASVDGAP